MRVGPRAVSAFRSDSNLPTAGQACPAAVTPVVVGRLRQSSDFVRVLAQPAAVGNRYFALHGLAVKPRTSVKAGTVASNLSTSDAQLSTVPVNKASTVKAQAVDGHQLWLGVIVPKRFARRAVTRTLVKRQIRYGVGRYAHTLPPGLWVVRLRAGFDQTGFASAASQALRAAVRREVEHLLLLMARATPLSAGVAAS
jgi:ribonuclease P protein component